MANPPNTPSHGIKGSANATLIPSSAIQDQSAGHETTSMSTEQASLTSDGNDKSTSPPRTRKRDKFRNFFRSNKTEVEDRNRNARPETNIHHPHAASNEVKGGIDNAGSNIRVHNLETGTQSTTKATKASLNTFFKNVNRPVVQTAIPKLGARIDSTSQLALCISLLPKNMDLSPHNEGLKGCSDQTKQDSHDIPTDNAHCDWIKDIEQNPIEQDHLHWLTTRMIEEFVKDPTKGSNAIAEIVLLGHVLDRELYRKLLSCVITEFKQNDILDVDLLQGLVQLVQCASPTYLVADDLIKILTILRTRLEDTHQHSTEHQYHLTLAVSHLLDVMADPQHKVKDLARVEESEPLALILSGLKTSSDPYLMYQAQYAFQALQYVPDDESAVQAVLRHSLGTAESLIKISGIIQLNFGGLLEGLQAMQKTVEETYGIAKSGYEGMRSLIDSGRGLFDSLREGFVSGHKLPWYPAILGATVFLRTGQLEELGKLIQKAPCRRDPRFQWGMSQLLGEIAIDPMWETEIREQAIDYLGDLYRNDPDWGQDESVKSWMLAILSSISGTPDDRVNERSHTLLQILKEDDIANTHPYPLRTRLPIPTSSPLLAIIQEIPYVEYDLDKLRRQRLEEYNQAVYIPPQAKAGLQTSDKDTFPLMEKVKEFLSKDNNQQVFLILGDSGAGKSTFNRHLEHELWKEYKQGGCIPLFINLPAITDPSHDMIDKQLQIHKFSEAKIKEMKEHGQMNLICDGYDETQLTSNLHTTNMLNQKGQMDIKMVISCRSTYIGHDYRDQFRPQHGDRYTIPATNLYTEAVIVPFSSDQIEDYVNQFVRDPEVHKLIGDGPIWSTEDYMNKLRSIPNMVELVRNPFLLSLSLRALPDVVKDAVDLVKVKVTRLTLYDSFIEQWLEINKLRLGTSKLSDEEKRALKELLEEGFVTSAIEFLKSLAAAIFREQDGNPVVQYKPISDKRTWKIDFFGPEPHTRLIRESSPLSRTGVQHRFIHRSLLEYFYSRHVYEINEIQGAFSEVSLNLADHPLNQRNLVQEPSIIQFLAEHVQDDSDFQQRLHQIIEVSKTDTSASQASANAITILVRAGVRFNGADLKGICVPGADLSGGQFDSAQLQGADLQNTNLRNVWLRQADLSQAQMADVQFGELPYLQVEESVNSCAYSPDGERFAVGLWDETIRVYSTATWEMTLTLSDHSEAVMSVMFSPDGQQIASGSYDKTVRLWNVHTGEPGAILSGHHLGVESVVFSPNGQQIASGSLDKTVWLWDAQTGELIDILIGHTDWITSVAFSPNGQQIVSCSIDKTVRLWDTQTGALAAILSGHTDYVRSVTFSPCGKHIASGSWDKTVRLWDAETGAPGAILIGHTASIEDVVFSPSGQQIASGSDDQTVRLWDAQTGAPGAILSGHYNGVKSVAFSPCGQQIACGGFDDKVRLWDVQTGTSNAIVSGHSDEVRSVAFSPNGQQIVSGSGDNTVRVWDTQTGAAGAILFGHSDEVLSVAFSPSDKRIVSGSKDKTVRLWDAQTGKPGAILSGHSSSVGSVAFSPSGQQIVSGSGDMTVRIWDSQTGAADAVLIGHTHTVTSVAFSPSGERIVSGSKDKTVRLWDVQTGAPSAVLIIHTSSIWSLVFSPSGQQIASDNHDKTVQLWDAQTGAPGVTLSGHTSRVTSVAFSPSGQQIASGSCDETVRLWDVESGRCLAVVKGFYGIIESIAWNASHDGSYIVTGCHDKSVRLWQVIEKGDNYHICLRWSSLHEVLTMYDTNFQSAQGLSKIHIKLVEQRGSMSRRPRLKVFLK